MARTKKTIDALSPLDAATDALLKLALFIAVVVVLGVSFLGFTVTGVNEPEICTVPNFQRGLDASPVSKLERQDFGLAQGIELRPQAEEACLTDPSRWQQTLSGLSTWPSVAVFVGFLVATRRVIRRARREGMFDRGLSQRVERLGWLVIIGLLAAAGIQWLADGLLKSTMYDTTWHSGSFHLSIVGLVGGYGVVAIGRVLARASDLQDDLEGTV